MALYDSLLATIAGSLGARCASLELVPPPGEPAAAPLALYGPASVPGELAWTDVPLRDAGEVFARVRLGFVVGPAAPEPRWLEAAAGLADMAAQLSHAHGPQASQSTQQASRRILPVTEEELQRVILDIHDGPVQKLFAAASQVELLQARLGLLPEPERAAMATELERVGNLLQASLGEIKTSLGAMRPPEFRRRPLVSVIHGLIMQHESLTGVGVELHVEGEIPPVSVPVKIALYRILQEALSNAYRHGGMVAQLDVRLLAANGWVILEVSDNGIGFEPPPLEGPTATERAEHIGLRGMRDRAQLVGGQFHLFSRPGAGTRIQVRVPTDE